MGLALETVGARVTNPGSTVTALTADTGSSFTVRYFPNSAKAYLDQMWSHSATPGIFRIRSPRLHDNSQGLRLQVGDTAPRLLLPDDVEQDLYPSDILTVEGTGGGAETDFFAYNVWYSDLGGVDARLATWAECEPRIVDVLGVEVDTTTSATAGDWNGGTAINASFDTFKANTDYCVMGYTTNTAVGAIAVSGPDTGNLKCGGPGPVDGVQTRDFFIRQQKRTGRPYIPIVNSNNRGATFLFVADPATSTSVHVSLVLGQLSA
jgi:hypothetical protein